MEDPVLWKGTSPEVVKTLQDAQAVLRTTLEHNIILNYNLLASATNLYLSTAKNMQIILETDIQVMMNPHGLEVPSVIRGTDLETQGGKFSPIYYRPTGFLIGLIPGRSLNSDDTPVF